MIRHAEAGVGHLARTGRAIYDATGHTTQSRARRRSAEPSGQGDCANCGSVRSWGTDRSEEHTSELQSQSTISYAVFCLKKKKEKLET